MGNETIYKNTRNLFEIEIQVRRHEIDLSTMRLKASAAPNIFQHAITKYLHDNNFFMGKPDDFVTRTLSCSYSFFIENISLDEEINIFILASNILEKSIEFDGEAIIKKTGKKLFICNQKNSFANVKENFNNQASL